MSILGRVHLKKFDLLHPCDERGNWSRYFNTKESIEKLGLEYKEGIGIKVLLEEMTSGPTLSDFCIIEYCVIHSYLASKGIAPEIYNQGRVSGYYYVEIEDVMNKKNTINVTGDIVRDACKESGFIIPHEIEFKYPDGKNFLNGYYLDFHNFKINWPKFKMWFSDVIKNSHWGNKSKSGEKCSYQRNVIVTGKRKVVQREKEMSLSKISFDDKTVLDVGCNLGVMSIWAKNAGAKNVTGIDCFKNFKLLADIYKFYTHTKDVTFIEEKIVPENIDKFGKFDIVFYFAVSASLGFPDKLSDIANELLIYEGHDKEDRNKTETRLKEIFNEVIFVGNTTDRSVRPIYYCYK